MEWIGTIVFSLIVLGILLYLFKEMSRDASDSEEPVDIPDSTRQMPKISEDFQIPEEDQQYLLPITVAVLKKLAFTKRMAPTNAMLIEHLAESLSEAARAFTPRKNNSQDPETGNEYWLWVAAFAIRLYDEGTPHNSTEAREGFTAQGTLATRRLEQWANKLNNEIIKKVKAGTLGEEDVRDVTEHIRTIGNTPYTEDEFEDMKKASDEENNIVGRIQKRRGK